MGCIEGVSVTNRERTLSQKDIRARGNIRVEATLIGNQGNENRVAVGTRQGWVLAVGHADYFFIFSSEFSAV